MGMRVHFGRPSASSYGDAEEWQAQRVQASRTCSSRAGRARARARVAARFVSQAGRARARARVVARVVSGQDALVLVPELSRVS